MKIISWNCNGKFREKYPIIQAYDADIYVIQECEKPEKYPKRFSGFYSNCCWCGENENKGLGIFAKSEIKLEINDWPKYCLRNFLSLKINSSFDLIGVWACSPYIEEYYIYQAINIDKYNNKTVIIGDFNSNAIWDKKHGKRNHGAVVAELTRIGIASAYHYVTGEQMGCESQSTFYLHKNKDKKYHIDYCFINPVCIKEFKILNSDEWLQYSDHLPIQITV